MRVLPDPTLANKSGPHTDSLLSSFTRTQRENRPLSPVKNVVTAGGLVRYK